MRLTTAEIDRYGPLYDCRPPCDEGITILSGPNEAGKTLYIEALLQILEPDVLNVMSPGPRVNQSPTGRVLVEYGGEEVECDGDTTLGDVVDIEPSHLDSVFVVRDSDLQLPSEQEYYTSLIEKLGDIHTTEINAIKSSLKDRGRLTPTRLNISSDDAYHDAGSVRDDAETLAEEIRGYVDHIEAESLDELETRRLRLKRELRESRQTLEVQQEAKVVAEYERLSSQLETVRETTQQLAELDEFDRDTLNELRELRSSINRDRDDLEEVEAEIEDQQSELKEISESLEAHKEELSQLEKREPAVDEARSELETFRRRQDDIGGAERRLGVAKAATIAGLIGAGVAGAGGAIGGSLPAIGLAVLLALVAVGSALVYQWTNSRLAAMEAARESVLRTARDAGFEVEIVEDIAPAIEVFNTDLSHARDRVARTEQREDGAQETLSDLETERSDLESRMDNHRSELQGELDAAGVDSLAEYKDRVEEREDLKPKRQTAQQSLIDRFGEPDMEEPDAKTDTWEVELRNLIIEVDRESVDAEDYDESELERLEFNVQDLQQELDELQIELEEHDDRLDDIDRAVRGLNTKPFIGEDLALDARSKDGLESLASDLDRVVHAIETDAELSRKAIKVFEKIEAQEEQKLTDLFAPDGPASRTFEQLTGGRYTEVSYDPNDHDLIVERRDGRTYSPDILSHGTKDQLYFATRVSLAQQLLGNEPGFFFLDDPFLAADPERLRAGFETLRSLADDGWQILYLTAKQEVYESVAEDYNLTVEKIESIPIE